MFILAKEKLLPPKRIQETARTVETKNPELAGHPHQNSG
jgi:hypothetical protein